MAVTSIASHNPRGFQPATADTDETLITAPTAGRLGLIGVLATIKSGLTTQTAVLKDDATVLARVEASPGQTTQLAFPNVLPLEGDLVVQATSTDVELTAWAATIA